jgi:hypothetical protein
VKNLVIALLVVLLLATSAGAVFFYRLARMQAPVPSGDLRPELAALESAAAWNQLVDIIRTAGVQALSEGDNGAISEQDAVERLHGLVTILATTMRMPLNNDPQFPLVVPSDLLPALSKIGGNSPDADYYNFPISPEYSYRLRGTRGKAPFFNIQVQGIKFDPATMRPGLALASSLSDADLVYDEDGFFHVLISTEKPADHEGLWMAMDEDSFTVNIREYHHDRAAEGEPEFHVEVQGDIPAPAPLTDAEVAAGIQRAAFLSKFWFDARQWIPGLFEPDIVNTFPTAQTDADTSEELGLNTDVQYMVGAWQLGPDEALVVEGRAAPGTPYWILQISDRWLETADFRRRTVHYNDHTIQLEPDGSFRAVISPDDPGVPNWLDTGGRTEGTMSFRWVPVGPLEVATRVVKRADLAPSGTR